MTAELPELLSFGGRRARWVWACDGDPEQGGQPKGSIPAGIIISHSDHAVLVPWVELPDQPCYELVQLRPLTIAEVIECPECGVAGRITAGRWTDVPASSEVGS